MATFGNTSAGVGTTVGETIEDAIRGGVFTLSEDALPTSMTAVVLVSLADKRIRMAIYRDSDDKLIAETDEVAVTFSASQQTITANFNRQFNLPAGDYRLCLWSSSGSGTSVWRYSATSGGLNDGEAETYTTPGERYPTTLTPAGVGGDDLMCIYCTYTPGTISTFGHELRESEFASALENDIRAGVFTMGAVAGTADSIVVWVQQTGSGSGETPDLKGAIYRVSDDVKIGETDVLTISDGDVQKWYTLDFSTPPSLDASEVYYVCVWAESSTTTGIQIAFLGSTGAGTYHQSTAFGSWPSDASGLSVVDSDGLMSIYVIYTEASAGATVRMLGSTGVGV